MSTYPQTDKDGNIPFLYHEPEKWGLSEIALLDYSSGDYEFDYRMVWADKKGRLYTSRDSGCSCPVPFEGIQSLSDLEDYNRDVIKREIEDELLNDPNYVHISLSDAIAFFEKIDNYIKNTK